MADPAQDVLAVVIEQLRGVFTNSQQVPPTGGGTDDVRFMAGDALPLAAWNAHSDGCGCKEPFLWVRLVQRYRTSRETFPAPTIQPGACHAQARALEIEIGAGRCAVTTEEPSFAEYAHEAHVSLDDSFRLDVALCRALSCLTGEDGVQSVAVGNITPFGPEGGIIANFANLWVLLN